jgi:hypothetical protein
MNKEVTIHDILQYLLWKNIVPLAEYVRLASLDYTQIEKEIKELYER